MAGLKLDERKVIFMLKRVSPNKKGRDDVGGSCDQMLNEEARFEELEPDSTLN